MVKNFRLGSLLGLSLIILSLAVILRYWSLIGIVLPLVIIFYYSLAIEEISIENLSVKRSLSRNRVEEKGELIQIELKLKNKGYRIPVLEILDNIPDQCTIHEGSNHLILELKANEEITLKYSIKCHKRGRYTIGPVVCRGFDIYGFQKKYKEFIVLSTFAAVPSLIKLKELPIQRQKLLPEVGNIPSLVYKGRDFDFQGVRDYQEGDELRTINWRVTAKYNRLATNEYALDQAAKVFIIFDHTKSTKRVLEEGVKATLSTAEFLISQRNNVGFFAIGEFIEVIPASMGKKQLLRINEFLIDCHPSAPRHHELISQRLQKKLLPSLPQLSQIFFISPLYDRSILGFLSELAGRGHIITLIRPSLESIVEYNPESPRESKLANYLLALDVNHTTKEIARLGITQFFWYPKGPQYESIKIRRVK
ncbi:MAG: DUF58 domain-containing protein [Candidatus Hodarchaeales archaeon]